MLLFNFDLLYLQAINFLSIIDIIIVFTSIYINNAIDFINA